MSTTTAQLLKEVLYAEENSMRRIEENLANDRKNTLAHRAALLDLLATYEKLCQQLSDAADGHLNL
jgi:hypothetical protein